MDVTDTLRILRNAAGDIESVYADLHGDWGDELIEVLEAFAALDGWLCRGGALPGDWSARH